MLVLTVKDNGSVKIGDDVTVTVRIVNGQVKLGIDAPREKSILRSELLNN